MSPWGIDVQSVIHADNDNVGVGGGVNVLGTIYLVTSNTEA